MHITNFLNVFYAVILYFGCLSPSWAQSSTNKVLLGNIIEAAENISDLVGPPQKFTKRSKEVDILFWNASEKINEITIPIDSIFNSHIKPLIDNSLIFNISGNRPYNSVAYLEYAMDITGRYALLSNYVNYASQLTSLYANVGQHQECEAVFQKASKLIHENERFRSEVNAPSNQRLQYKMIKLQVFEMRLSCHLADDKATTAYLDYWQDSWQEIRQLYKSNALLPFVYKDMSEGQYSVLRSYLRNKKGILAHLPVNTALLQKLFDYFYRTKNIKAVSLVKKTLLKWHKRNLKITYGYGTHASEAKYELQTNVASGNEEDNAESRLYRIKRISSYQRQLINAKWLLLNGEFDQALIYTTNALDIVESASWDKWNYFFLKIANTTDQLRVNDFEALASHALALELNGQYAESAQAYDKLIEISELNREQVPLAQRRQYFRSSIKEAYLGAYRARAKLLRNHLTDKNILTQFISAGEKLRSRQLKEELGLNSINEFNKINKRVSIPDNEILFINSDVGSELISFLQTRESVKIKIVPKPLGWDDNIFSLRNSIAKAEPLNEEMLRAMSRTLFSEMEESLYEAHKIWSIVDGVLSYLPLGVFSGQHQPLGITHRIQSVMSVNNVVSNENKINLFNKGLLAIADPNYNQKNSLAGLLAKNDITLSPERTRALSGYFSPLPETRDEVISIAKIFNKNTLLLLGDKATETALTTRENHQEFQVAHFATHGILGGELKGVNEPALILTADESSDGILLASEVAQLKLNVELAVLSACNTGNGEYFLGEGIQGMARSFALAGANNVLVSLWPVDSNTTKELMVSFYKHLKQSNQIDLALQLAQQDIYTAKNKKRSDENRGLQRKTNKNSAYSTHPFYWAPFILIKVR